MKASLCLERIGDDLRLDYAIAGALINAAIPDGARAVLGPNPRTTWVAEIIGPDPRYGLRRVFLRPRIDYRHANGAGSRGVVGHYILESGRVYEVKAWRSWRSEDRYFCRVNPHTGDIERIDRDEVQQWPKWPKSGVAPSE